MDSILYNNDLSFIPSVPEAYRMHRATEEGDQYVDELHQKIIALDGDQALDDSMRYGGLTQNIFARRAEIHQTSKSLFRGYRTGNVNQNFTLGRLNNDEVVDINTRDLGNGRTVTTAAVVRKVGEHVDISKPDTLTKKSFVDMWQTDKTRRNTKRFLTRGDVDAILNAFSPPSGKPNGNFINSEIIRIIKEARERSATKYKFKSPKRFHGDISRGLSLEDVRKKYKGQFAAIAAMGSLQQ